MTDDIKNIIEPELLKSFIELADKETILQTVLKKATSQKEFINSLLSALILVLYREAYNLNMISDIIKNNPQIQEFLEAKNDPFLLPKIKEAG